MIRALVVILVLAAGSYGILWGFLYYRTMAFMDDMAAKVDDRGELTYGGISPDLTGKISVSDIRFQLHGADDDFSVDRASLVGPDALFFVQLFQDLDFQRGKFPERFGLHIEGLRIDVLGDSVRMLQPAGAADEADGCEVGAVGADTALLQAMGVRELVVDTDFGWHHDKADGRVTANVEAVIEGVQSFDASLELAGVPEEGFTGGMQQMPTLAGFEVGAKIDEDFGARYAKACAERMQITQQEFKTSLVEGFKQQLAAVGIEPGFGISYAIDAFYRDWGELRLSATPDRPVGMLSLMALPPDRLADALGLGMTVNGSPVADFKFTWKGPQMPAFGQFGGMLGQADAGDSARSEPRKPRPRYRKEYRRVGIQELPRYLSYPVRIKSAGQPTREGLLASFDGKEIRVQQRLHGGKFTAHVPADSVQSIEVEVRVRIDPEADADKPRG